MSSKHPAPPLPVDEAARLRALYRARALSGAARRPLDDLAALAAQVCGTPIAAVSLVTEDEQVFAGSVGLEVPGSPRAHAVCAYAVLQDDVLVIPDTAADPRTRHNPLLLDVGARTYAGAQIRTRDGLALGTVCVLDVRPRVLGVAQLGSLSALARQASLVLEWGRARPSLSDLMGERAAVGSGRVPYPRTGRG